MTGGISESRFNMWRAVVAVIHADGVVKPHEINFIFESTKDLPLSEEQRSILNGDIYTIGDVQTLFQSITNPKDKEDFFHLARGIAWADGDFDIRENDLLIQMGGLAMQGEDMGLLRASSESFNEIYVMEKETAKDLGLFAIIKRMMRRVD